MSAIKWLFNWAMLVLAFFRELTLSVYDVILNVLNPKRITQSAIVEVPLEVKSDLGIALLANMVTLTPGTTTLYVSDDKTRLYAHVMNYSGTTVSDIKQRMERQVLKVLK